MRYVGGKEMIIKITSPNDWYKVDRECVVEIGNIKHLRPFILERDNYTCVYCGDKEGPFEVDHVMPKSRGGTNDESNLVCSCRSCNRAKKDRTPEEWMGL